MYSDGCSCCCCCCCRQETSERLNRDLLVSNNCTEEYPALIIISCFRLPLLFFFPFMRLNLAPLLPLDSLIDQSTLSSALDSYSHRHSLEEMMLLLLLVSQSSVKRFSLLLRGNDGGGLLDEGACKRHPE